MTFLIPLAWAQQADELEDRLKLEIVNVQVGPELVKPLVSGESAPLLKEMGDVRKQIEEERGFVLPGVRFHDNLSLKPKEWVIYLRGQEVARGQVEPKLLLAAARNPASLRGLPGLPREEKIAGRTAKWIAPAGRARAEKAGCIVLTPELYIGWYLKNAVISHAWQVFGRQEMLVLMPELLASTFNTDLAAQDRCLEVCENLLRERLPLRVKSVAELVLDKSQPRQDADSLTEVARGSIKTWICEEAALPDTKTIPAVVLSPAWEAKLRAAVHFGPDGLVIRDAFNLEQELEKPLSAALAKQPDAVLCVPDDLRLAVRRLSERQFSDFSVLAQSEIAAGYSAKKVQEI
ncbi:MAG: FHIPEP family type III secretion protein [Candidatus Eremiobacteraeota bacterium]|nr:FHIPEP family type III secretion protein [Candidatus Eremiobacteraeota bacterium]MCW5869356.1 FHIPEP family type III secretion protein [Candidatus Eremiobacteraeota bacterium]